MFTKANLTRVLYVVLAVLLLVSCAPAAQAPFAADAAASPAVTAAAAVSEPAQTNNVSFTDMGGNVITLPAPATRIVALTPADVEILFAIGAEDTLVGCGEYCTYPPEAADIPVMQTGTTLNLEQLLAVAPEVLLLNPAMLMTGTVAETEEQVERLAEAGTTIVISDAKDIAGVYAAIGMLGTLTGRTAAAEAVVSDMRAAFNAVKNVGTTSGKTVYFEISPLEYGLWTAGTGTFMDEIAGMLGLSNCFADVTGYGEISEEQILARNPDYIVTITMYFGEGPTPAEEIAARPGWETVTAVQTDAILSLMHDELSRPGPRLAEGAKLLGALVAGAESHSNAA